jgi:hypothetical protein
MKFGSLFFKSFYGVQIFFVANFRTLPKEKKAGSKVTMGFSWKKWTQVTTS